MSASPTVKFQPWKVLINGVRTVINVVSDYAVDLTTPAGTAGPFSIYNNSNSYNAGAIVVVQTNQSIGGVTLTPGTYGAMQYVPANGTGNNVPQFPMPASNPVWALIALGPQLVNICQNGSKNIYVNSSTTF